MAQVERSGPPPNEASDVPESARRRRERLLAALDDEAYRRLVVRMKDRFADQRFWTDLCPELTISDRPFAPEPQPYPITEHEARECADTVAFDGYFTTGPIVRTDEAAKVLLAATRLVAAGYPSGFACVYDEFWRLFQGLETLVSPMLDEDYLLVPDGLWTFFVPEGSSGLSGWSALGPHRDSLGTDTHLATTGRPGILTIWIALTDATPLNSCMHVLPASVDDCYMLTDRSVRQPEVPLADVRALPAAAGSVLGWTSNILHWGSRSSPRAPGPRVSAAMYLQRRDWPRYAPNVMSFDDPVPFERRIAWLAHSMSMPDLFGDEPPARPGSGRSGP